MQKIKYNILIITILGLLLVLSIGSIKQNSEFNDVDKSEIIKNHLKSAGTFYDIEIDNLNPSKDWAWAVTQSWCSGSGTPLDPYIIEYHTFKYQSGSGNGLLIENSNQYFVIRNCKFTGSISGGSFPYYAGLKLNNVNNGLIQKSEFSSNDGRGIILYDSDYNNFFNNTISNNRHWIAIASLCDNNDISDNLIENNVLDGVHFETTLAYENNYNDIISNKIFNNGEHGIYLSGRNDFNHLIDNDIVNSNSLGIGIMSMNDNNTSYLNFLIGNGQNGADHGLDNKWNSSLIGNYWDDYRFTDNNGDGIGDTTYTYGALKDYLPIVDDLAPNITIISPTDNEEFSNPPSFQVIITDRYPNLMWYTLNNGNSKYYFSSNNTIAESAWNSVPAGNVIIKFYANDRALNEAFQEIIVAKPFTISFGLIPIIAFSLIGVVIVLSKTLKQKKKHDRIFHFFSFLIIFCGKRTDGIASPTNS